MDINILHAKKYTLIKKYFSSYWIRSAFFSILQRFSTMLFALVSYMMLIRHLSKEDMGAWALFLIIITVFETTKTSLLKGAHVKYMSANTDQKEKTIIASCSFMINGSITLAFVIILIVFSNKLGFFFPDGPKLSKMLLFYTPGLLFNVFFSHFEATQQAHFDFKGVFIGYLTRQIVFFILILFNVFSKTPLTLTHLAIYQSITVFLGTIAIYYDSRKYLLHKFEFSIKWTKTLMGYGGYLFGSGVATNIYANLDQLMVAKFMNSATPVSYYNAASRIDQLINIPTFVAAEILFPKASNASATEGIKKVRYLFEKMIAILLCFTIPSALFIMIFPKLMIFLITGPAYYAAAPILQLYMITGILRPLQNQSANILNSIGKTGLCFAMNCIYLATSLLINYICLQFMPFYGAAVGSVIAFTLVSVVWYFVINKHVGLGFGNVLKNMRETYQLAFNQTKNIISSIRNPSQSTS